MRITYPEHCGNSPKKVQLIDLHKAIINGDASFLLASLSSDVVLNVVGESVIVGRENVAAAARDVVKQDLREIRIKDVITHGNVAAVHGSLLFEGRPQVDFCDVYGFSGFGRTATIKKIDSYRIPIGTGRGL
ncbi:MAG: nuclear transport factor 2 family protein [Limnochordia bacterium]